MGLFNFNMYKQQDLPQPPNSNSNSNINYLEMILRKWLDSPIRAEQLLTEKYYSQGGVTYLCSRDTGNPVYHALRDLVGIYVEPLA